MSVCIALTETAERFWERLHVTEVKGLLSLTEIYTIFSHKILQNYINFRRIISGHSRNCCLISKKSGNVASLLRTEITYTGYIQIRLRVPPAFSNIMQSKKRYMGSMTFIKNPGPEIFQPWMLRTNIFILFIPMDIIMIIWCDLFFLFGRVCVFVGRGRETAE